MDEQSRVEATLRIPNLIPRFPIRIFAILTALGNLYIMVLAFTAIETEIEPRSRLQPFFRLRNKGWLLNTVRGLSNHSQGC